MATKWFSQLVCCLLIAAFLPLASDPPVRVLAQEDSPSTPVTATEAAGQPIDGDWWAQAQAAIRAAEYEVTWQENLPLPETAAAFQAPNRGQGLRTYFLPAGIVVLPRGWTGDVEPAWRLRLAQAGAATAELSPEGNRVAYRRSGAVTEWYRNEPTALTQDFEIASGAAGQGGGAGQERAVVALAVETGLVPALAVDGQAIDFADAAGKGVLRYAGVQATDAAGRRLPMHLALTPTGASPAGGYLLQFLVDTADAAYPLAVSGALSSLAALAAPGGLGLTPAWTAESDQADAWFGYSVATAGDVNGDGYADVIVGASEYDNGQAGEGRAYVYYGSAGGLSGSPGWTAEGNQAGAAFGSSVATAGDVNGDGYADVIVGASEYDNGQADEGRAHVYHGSAGGLSGSPGWTAESNQAGAWFGSSVATAGDVNGDGYADVIVGARYYDNGQTDEGMAHVYHGSAGGLGLTSAWTAEGNQAGASFGLSVATAGDVNGDGCADVIVGAFWYDNGQTDEGRAWVYHGSPDGLGLTSAWTAEGNQAGASFGLSVATAGDVNGDGYADVIVGAFWYDNGQTDEGRAYVYYGSAGGLSGSPGWTAESDQADAWFGSSVATAGDVNGDGYADVIVGAPYYDNGQTNEGRAYVYHGSAGGLSGSPGWTAESDQAGAWFGYPVATAGDVNGDGYADVIVGALYYDNGQTDEGRAWVYHGSAGGLGLTSAWTAESNQAGASFGYSVATAGDVNGDGYADVIVGASEYDNGQDGEGRAWIYHGSASGLSGSPGWTAESDQAGAWFGSSVATAGDVNGDGYADVIVGAPYYDNGQTNEGRAYVYHGSAGGLSDSPGWTAESDQAGAYFSYSVATAGDVNGDGYADVIVGAFWYDNGQTYEGRAYVYFGSAGGLSGSPGWTAESDQVAANFGLSVATAGDVNGDGYADVIVGAPLYDHGLGDEGRAYVYHGLAGGLSGSAAWTAESDQAGASFGLSVATAGDVNGDGYADVIVGARYNPKGQTYEGRAYVYHGSAGGLSGSAAWTAESNQTNAGFGYPVATAGDVNGDGYADVIVGAPGYDNGQTDEGRAYVYFGSAGGLSSSSGWTAESDQAGAIFGRSVATAGDVNGDGYADVIVGAPFYDNGQTDEGMAFVYYGAGGGLPLLPRQRRGDNTAPIALGGKSDRTDGFRLALLGRTPFGRGKVKLEWEVKPLGTLFDGRNTGTSSTWLSTGTAGVSLGQLVTGLASGTPYHWRVRLRYHPATSPFQQYSRWMTMPWNGWNETDLRTGKLYKVYLPLAMRN